MRQHMLEKERWVAWLFGKEMDIETYEKRRVALHIAKNIIENEISARQKQILVLYYKEGKTIPEIAQMLGVNRSTVSRTRRRAFEAVRSRLVAYRLMG